MDTAAFVFSVRTGFLTVILYVAVREPHFAVIVTVPAFLAVTFPAAFTVATFVLLLVYFTVPVTPVLAAFTVTVEGVPFV